MFVIFWIDEKKYYSSNAQCHWVEEMKAASTFNSREKACNFAKSGLKDKIHVLEYIEVGAKTEAGEVVPVPDLTKEEAEMAYEELRKAAEIFGKAAENIPALMKYYQNIQTEQDKLQQDLLHKFEFTSPGNIIFVKLGRMLKTCRLKRREAKDRLGYLIAIGNAVPKNVLKTHCGHDDLLENRVYEPRIAPELFD